MIGITTNTNNSNHIARDNSRTKSGLRRRLFVSIVALLFQSSVEALIPAVGHCLQPNRMASHHSVKSMPSLDAFAQMRSGICPDQKKGDAVYWTADGELYETPSGRMLARIEGLETSKAFRMDNNVIRIFSRKLVWFRHPETNEIMDKFEGQEIPPIKFDAQVFDVKQGQGITNTEDDPSLAPIMPFVVRSKRLLPCMPITPRWGGCDHILMYQVPLFIDLEIPVIEDGKVKSTRKYQAWEFYDYVYDTNQKNPPTLSWTRQGSTPPFCINGNGVTHARGHRVDSFEDLPQSTQDYVNENFPLFRGPPKSMEEVDKLLGDDD